MLKPVQPWLPLVLLVSSKLVSRRSGPFLTSTNFALLVFSAQFNLNSTTQQVRWSSLSTILWYCGLFINRIFQWQILKASSNEWAIQSVSTGYYLVANGAPGTSALKLSTTALYWQILPYTANSNSFLCVLLNFSWCDSRIFWRALLNTYRIQKPSTSIVVTQISTSAVDIQPLSSPPAEYQGWAFTLLSW